MKKLLALVFLIFMVDRALADPPVATPYSPVTAFWRIPNHYRLVADGADDAPSIQRAINAACAASPVWGQGGIVRLMPQHYKINSQITITCRVALEGVGWQEAPDPAGSAPTASPNASAIAAATGTWFDIGASFKSKVSPTQAPILITGTNSTGAAIKNIAFAELDMTVPAANATTWTPDSYPPVIYDFNTGGMARFENLYFHGVYAGLYFNNAGRPIIEGLYGQIFTLFVFMDQILDNARINNIHAWPYWSQNAGVFAYTQANAQTLLLNRVDTPLIDNIVSFGTAYGINIGPGAQLPGTTTRAMVGKLSCDSNAICLGVNAQYASISIGHMTTFGQKGASSGVPLAGARAIKIGGSGNVHVGYLYAAMFDHTVIEDTSTTYCSTVQVDSPYIDFTYSGSGAVNILMAGTCTLSGTTTNNQVFFGAPPIITTVSGQSMTYHNGAGAKVFTPNVSENP